MSVSTYCKHRVVTIEPHADLAEAASRMRENHVGLLVVVNSGEDRPIGVLTDRDIVVQVVARNIVPGKITVADALTADPVVARDWESLSSISERMRSSGVRRIPVVNDKGALVGIIASDDIVDLAATMIFNVSCAVHKEQSMERREYA